MKKILLIILSFVLIVPIMAQRKYEVYKLNGDVQIMQKNTGKWSSVTVHMVLGEDDVISVPKNGSVSILEPKSGRIYMSDGKGKHSVKKRIEKAEKDADKLFRQVNRELARTADKDAKNNNGYVSYAASSRGNTLEPDIYDSVYALLMNMQCSAFQEGNNPIVVHKKKDGNNMCHYSVINNSTVMLYFNAVVVRDGEILPLYDFNSHSIKMLPIRPGDNINLASYIFSDDVENVIFLFSERLLSLQKLMQLTRDDLISLDINRIKGISLIKIL